MKKIYIFMESAGGPTGGLSIESSLLMLAFEDRLTRLSFSPTMSLSKYKSYVTWNKKGGVGKTTLTFHMATHYALTHPFETVLVIDLCPQANVSMALIGKENVDKLTSEGRTISFYLRQQYILFTSRSSPVDPQDFLIHVSDFNNQIPPNVQLLCGDIHLETVARSLELERSVGDDSSWVSVTSSVRYFIEGDGFSKPGIINQANDKSKWVVFIDTNPSFAVYTEIALLAAERLIIPVNADDFSREAFKSLLHSVYGIAEDELPFEFKLYENKLTFSQKARENRLRLPLIHLLIHNRATRYNLRSAQAFHQLAISSFDVLQCAFKSNSECFAPKPLGPLQGPQVDQYLVDLYDFHTTGIVALHHGCPLAALRKHYTLNCVPIVNGTVKLDSKQINIHLQNLDNLVAKL